MDFKENDGVNKEFHESSKVRSNNKSKYIGLIVAALILTNLFSLYAGSIMAIPLGKKVMVDKDKGFNEAFSSFSGVSKYKKLFEVRDALYQMYLGDINEDILVEGAVKGMTEALEDPYTVFMNQKEYTDFNAQTEGSYVGLGLQVGIREEKITVIAPFDNSPAKSAGIITGDIIEKVNGKDVAGKDLELAVSMMRGNEGEAVTVTLFREGTGSYEVTMKRAKITLVSVTGEMLDNNIGYVQLSMFDEHTGTDFVKLLNDLKKKGMKGLVLDLRGNPGGLLSTCVDITSQFVPKGQKITYTKDKLGREYVYASKGGVAQGLPLVVLTDGGTASASEILSGAVRDYKLGTLIGTNTFGKGLVQTMKDFEDGTALKVTISKYYTPNGENINKIGIKPDIEIKLPEELLKKYDRNADPQFKKALEVVKDKVK